MMANHGAMPALLLVFLASRYYATIGRFPNFAASPSNAADPRATKLMDVANRQRSNADARLLKDSDAALL